jgi:hypothetical protein
LSFRSTSIKLFYENPYSIDSKTNINILLLSDENNNIQAIDPIIFILGLAPPEQKEQDRSKGSKNKRKIRFQDNNNNDFVSFLDKNINFENQFVIVVARNQVLFIVFMISKEKANIELYIQLRAEGKICIPSGLFELSDKKEIDRLTDNQVIRIEIYDTSRYPGIRVFNTRLVRELKNKGTSNIYEKSKIIIQVFKDFRKEFILC